MPGLVTAAVAPPERHFGMQLPWCLSGLGVIWIPPQPLMRWSVIMDSQGVFFLDLPPPSQHQAQAWTHP